MAFKRSFHGMNGTEFHDDFAKFTSVPYAITPKPDEWSFHFEGPQATIEPLRKQLSQIKSCFPKQAQNQDQQISLSNLKSLDTPFNFLSLEPGHRSDLPSPLPFDRDQNLLPGQGIRVQSHTDDKIRPGLSNEEQASAQLTIFYSGMVNVYDNIPADDAYALMLLAGNASPQFTKLSSAKNLFSVSNTGVTATTAALRVPARNATALPLSRNKSLARFLKGRKDRLTPHKLITDNTIDMSSHTRDLKLALKEKVAKYPKREISEKPPNRMSPLAGLEPGRDQESETASNSNGHSADASMPKLNG